MALTDIVDAADGELLGLFVLGTYAVAMFFGGLLGDVRRWSGRKIPSWTPSFWVASFLWLIFYTLNGVAAYLVRVAPGGGVWVANGRALWVYVALQGILALYWLFAAWWWAWLVILFVFLALITGGIVAWQFYAFSTTATVLIAISMLWLLFVLVLHFALALGSSGELVRSVARTQSTAGALESGRRSRIQRETEAEKERIMRGKARQRATTDI